MATEKQKQQGGDPAAKHDGTASFTRQPIDTPPSTTKYSSLAEAILESFQLLGGVEGVVAWAKRSGSNLTEFYKLAAKMLPSNVDIKVTKQDDNELVKLRAQLAQSQSNQIPSLPAEDVEDAELTQSGEVLH